MPQDRSGVGEPRLIRTADISGKERYQLLTSLVVPRPIGWLSTFAKDGTPNLAPFSYFAALADTPMLVGVSIGWRAGEPKDTLRNILETRVFCINVVTEPQLEAMNATSGDYRREVDEFKVAGLPMAEGSVVRAPFVENCPAVMECRLYKEVELGTAPNSLVLGEVLAVRLGPELQLLPGTHQVETESLRPVGRLFAGGYTLLGKIKTLPRPRPG
ncbi:MAG: flavin reductase family protein [Gemmatimonadetes bacterium]|nr:flavin reductase family protein [Gemmatimonadota bacterium]NIO32917.1 flavin reductase family protein [Gemmatimonadota bacterium]